MNQTSGMIRVLIALAITAAIAVALPTSSLAQQWPDENACASSDSLEPLQQGWCLAIDPTKGNCLACHTFNINPWPANLPVAGNIAPPMVAMEARFPDRNNLRMVIEDATRFNVNSIMPPYLTHEILNEKEIDLIINFLLSL